MDDTHRPGEDGGASPGPRAKVARLVDRYDMGDVGAELEANWTRTDGRMSLRDLAAFFNERLIECALREQSATPLDGEVSNYYRLLTDDDISSGMRVQAENRLEQQGVDVDQLREDFVSRQAIHTYLRRERGAEYERSDDEAAADAADQWLRPVQRLKNRLVAVAEERIDASDLRSGDVHVTALVRVRCADCGTQRSIAEFARDGGCACGDDA